MVHGYIKLKIMNYLKIIEINVGNLQEKKANAIVWSVTLMHGTTSVDAQCSLIYVNTDGGTIDVNEYFTMNIPNNILQQWGADDSVIDNYILTYSPLFIKDEANN